VLKVRWHGCFDDEAHEGTRRRKSPFEKDICGGKAESGDRPGGTRKKVVRPSQRKEMAKHAVVQRQFSVRLACKAFGISETCYRYQAKLSGDNMFIADWLLRLTTSHRTWGFGLCYLYLRNVKGCGYNHKRVYRIYRELELNLRIKPKRRLKREKPEELAVPRPIKAMWSMDFISSSSEGVIMAAILSPESLTNLLNESLNIQLFCEILSRIKAIL
jgi:putative transposase